MRSVDIKTLGHAARVYFKRPGVRRMLAFASTAWTARAALGGRPRKNDALLAASVVVGWGFQEWLAHKYLLHLKPRVRANGSKLDPLFARAHRAHHRDPYNLDNIFLPVVIIYQAMPASAVIWRLITPNRQLWLTGLASYSTMALVYEWIHYLTHTGYTPRSSWMQRVRRNHYLHHFRHEDYWFAFVMPSFDAALGTDPEPTSIARSETVRDLHGLGPEEFAELDAVL